MDIANDFAGFQSAVQSALVATTRKVSQITAQDIAFHRSLDPAVASQLDRQNARLLALSERLLANAAAGAAAASAGADAVGRPTPRLPDPEALDTHWTGVVDVVDSLLERADISLDEYTGTVKRLSPSRDSTPSRSIGTASGSKPNAFRSANILKPQRLFEHPPDNATTSPFKPLLETKPHAQVSLKKATEPETDKYGVIRYPHPYKYEIEHYQYPSSVYTRTEPIPYHDFDSTSGVLVDTEQGVLEMLEELKQAKEIAVDLEHHDTRSYVGIVSLMQISTRDRDWIVDTLKPWRRKLQCLNQVFADPSIVKVLHGAMMDAVWLQRDLGVYLVGLFDTHHAAKVLGYQGGSLAFLLKKFANVDAQKQYQTADWRIRPLPQPLLDYARSDTHYLLFIYDKMRNELIRDSHLELPDHKGDLIHEVLTRSKRYALQTYTNDVYDVERGIGSRGWYNLVWKSPALLDRVQFAVFRAVHKWRDAVAREQDDGLHHVMPNWNIFSLAREMPTAKAGLLGICQPPTETVRLRADELLAVIAEAREAGQDAREMFEIVKEVDVFLHGERTIEDPSPAARTVTVTDDTKKAPKNPFPVIAATSSTRSDKSSFWGRLLNRVGGRKYTTLAPHLSVPLPPLTAEIFSDSASGPNMEAEVDGETGPGTGQDSGTSNRASDPPSPRRDDIFTLKERNNEARKRSGEQMSADHDRLASNADVLSLGDELGNAGALGSDKAARRAARKARKAAKRVSETGSVPTTTLQTVRDEGEGQEAEAEFDYANAKSVFNAVEEARKMERKNKRRKTDGDVRVKERENVNPFVKAMDAPRGLPRGHRERAGKSMTFKK